MSVRATSLSLARILRANDRTCGSQPLTLTGITIKHWSKCHYSNDGTQKRRSSILSSSSVSPLIDSLKGKKNKILLKSRQTIYTSEALIQRNIDGFFNWYDNVTHTNEIREAHRKVDDLQDKLNQAQLSRREVLKELHGLRNELQRCSNELNKCQRGEPRYIELMTREFEILQNEKQKNEEFNLLDKTERDLFIHLQAAVKTSHEKEKVHTNSAKYWSIVGTLAGALLGICGTAFSFYNRNDLLAEINKMFVNIHVETKAINSKVEHLKSDQWKLFDFLRRRDQNQLEEIARKNVSSKVANNNQNNGESWAHWIGRKTYVISVYRYFVPKNNT